LDYLLAFEALAIHFSLLLGIHDVGDDGYPHCHGSRLNAKLSQAYKSEAFLPCLPPYAHICGNY
jgi:hypothetical protein